MAKPIVALEAHEDLFGTYRVIVVSRDHYGQDRHVVIHNVPRELIEELEDVLGIACQLDPHTVFQTI